MARENQGLQIALIIFFMLTIILGVTTFIFFRQCEEAEKKATTEAARANEEHQGAVRIAGVCNKLMEFLGFGPNEQLAAVETQFNDDMQKYGGPSYPPENRDYHQLLDYLFQANRKKNEELTDVQNRIDQLAAAQAKLLAEEKQQVVKFQTAAKTANDRATAVDASAKNERDRITKDQAGLATQLADARKKAQTDTVALQETIEQARDEIDRLETAYDKSRKDIKAMTSTSIDVPDGEIRWVNQHNQTVWVNLGRADGLGRQVTFSVYPIDTTNLAKAGKKASIEVTQILGEHLAEARVIEDDVSDPIMLGDKIHTPLWSPGEHKRFALAGFMDIDEDGKSDQHIVRDLIRINGGTVDCETVADAEGNVPIRGKMSENISYLVLGERPTGENQAEVDAFSKIIGDAEKLRTQVIQLGELLQQMGWKSRTSVVRFGRGANPKDFRAKPPDGVPKVSPGNVSDLFKSRRPPAGTRSGRGGAY